MIKKLRVEYQELLYTKFWEAYQKRIAELMKSASTDTDTIDPNEDATKLARAQGKIDAFKIILGLPEKIIKDT